MTNAEKARWFITHPAELGRAIGYEDLQEVPHGQWIQQMVTAERDMTLQAHRGSYKTTCLCVAIALLMIWRPRENIIFLRKTDNDVAEVVKNVKRILLTDVFRGIYTALTGRDLAIARDNSSEITLSNYTAPRGAAQLLGIGIGGSITGKHADIIITDDIINLRDRVSRAERERTKGIYMELQNVRNPGGRIINTGTPWHKDDAFTLMPEPDKWDYKRTGMLDEEEIEGLRKSMIPTLFAANYELKHIASDDALFTESPTYTKDASLLKDGIAHVDAAYGGEDYTAFTCGQRRGGKLYMYGKLWHRHVDTLMDTIIQDCKRLRCGPIFCESNADKAYLAKEFLRKGFAARSYTESENKYLKIAEYLRKWWPNIVWLEGTDDEYIDMIMDYTIDAEHDDAPDSAACVVRWFDKH